MSNIDSITTGNIVTDKEADTRYRIIYVSVNDIVLCEWILLNLFLYL